MQALLYHDAEGLGRADGEGQARQCKDFSKLEEWSQGLEHNSCFVRELSLAEGELDYYQHFRHCPPDSPYFDRMREHFGYSADWEIDYDFPPAPTIP